MGYEISLANYLSLPLLGLVVYWYGLFFTNYFPFKCTKEEIYQYGVIFLVINFAAPLLISIFITVGTLSKANDENSFTLLLISIIFYAISGFFITTLSQNVSKARKNNLELFLNKKVGIKSFEILVPICWVYVISTAVTISLIYLKIPNTIDYIKFGAIASLILATLTVMSIASSLFGYKEISFPLSIIKLKDNYIPVKGRIIKYDDYVTYFDGEKKLKIKEDYVISITDKE